MPDALDRLLFFLERHWRAVLGSVSAVVLIAVIAKGLIGGGEGGGQKPLPQGAVAAVGETVITQQRFDHWTEIFRKTSGQQEGEVLSKTVLQGLVASAWTEQEAERLGVTVSDADVDQAVQSYVSQAQQQGITKQQLLEQFGGTEQDLRWQQRVSLLSNALQTRAAEEVDAPTGEEIQQRYAEDGVRWSRPSVRDVRMLVAADEAAAGKAAEALRAGRSWKKVGNQYGSKEVDKAVGTLRNARPGKRESAFERALFAASVGNVSEPAQFSWGWTVFEVVDSDPLDAIPLQRARKVVRSELTSEAQSAALADYLEGFRDRWKKQTRCGTTIRDTTVCPA
jgi:parvulin-like peptidyl-prolyl isomerase